MVGSREIARYRREVCAADINVGWCAQVGMEILKNATKCMPGWRRYVFGVGLEQALEKDATPEQMNEKRFCRSITWTKFDQSASVVPFDLVH